MLDISSFQDWGHMGAVSVGLTPPPLDLYWWPLLWRLRIKSLKCSPAYFVFS